MRCPNCGSYSVKVVDTLSGEDDLSVYRRRKCIDCDTKFRTVETIDDGSEEFEKGYFKAMKDKSPKFVEVALRMKTLREQHKNGGSMK